MTAEPSPTTSDRDTAEPAESWSAQLRRLLPVLLVVVAGIAVVSVVLAAFGHLKHIDLPDLTRDPSAVTHTHFWVGALSFLGFAAWGIGAGAALAAGLVQPRGSARRRTLLQVSAITGYLLLDDMLLFHEEVLPNLGVPEKIIYPTYFVIVALWVWFNRADIRRTEWVLLVVAFLAFASSIGIDQVAPDIGSWTYIEDCAKFAGIVVWSFYLVRTAIRSVRAAEASPVPAP